MRLAVFMVSPNLHAIPASSMNLRVSQGSMTGCTIQGSMRGKCVAQPSFHGMVCIDMTMRRECHHMLGVVSSQVSSQHPTTEVPRPATSATNHYLIACN